MPAFIYTNLHTYTHICTHTTMYLYIHSPSPTCAEKNTISVEQDSMPKKCSSILVHLSYSSAQTPK